MYAIFFNSDLRCIQVNIILNFVLFRWRSSRSPRSTRSLILYSGNAQPNESHNKSDPRSWQAAQRRRWSPVCQQSHSEPSGRRSRCRPCCLKWCWSSPWARTTTLSTIQWDAHRMARPATRPPTMARTWTSTTATTTSAVNLYILNSSSSSEYFDLRFWFIQWCSLENQQSLFYVVNRDSLCQDYIP